MIYPSFEPILLLGDTGFLGTAVKKELDARKIPYFGASRKSGIDLREAKQILEIVRNNQFSSVINCAAHVGGINYGLKNQIAIFEDNLRINLVLLDIWSESRSRLINPISNCAYPGNLNRFSENRFWDGAVHESVYAYAHTRRTLVASTKIYAEFYNLEVSNLIFPNIYGPGERRDPEIAHALGGLVHRMIQAKQKNDERFVVWGSGFPVREWLFIEDAAHILVEASLCADSYPLRNFGIGEGISIFELARLIALKLDYHGSIEFDPTKPDGAPEKIMEINENYPSLTNHKYVELSVGIEKTISWYLRN